MLDNLQLSQILSGVSLREAAVSLFPLATFAVSMIIYVLFIYKLYKLISTRDIIRISEGTGYSRLHGIVYGLEYVFLFPIISFVWFFVMAVILASLSPTINTTTTFMAAMAALATIRATAYYEEELSREIAKVFPFALLAVFLSELSVEQPNAIFFVLNELPLHGKTLFYYFLFAVGLELVLRLFSSMEHMGKSIPRWKGDDAGKK